MFEKYLVSAAVNCFNPCRDVSASLKGTIIDEKLTFTDDRGDECLSYCIYLPPGYDSSNKDKTFPILYHLHGGGEPYFYNRWVVSWFATEFEKANLQMIIAAPFDKTRYGLWDDGDMINIASQIRMNFIPKVESVYNIKAERCSRFIQGFSMGGQGAFVYGLKDCELFGKIISWDGSDISWGSLSTSDHWVWKHVAKSQFNYDEKKFHPWCPYKAVVDCAKMNKLKDRPILMISSLSNPQSSRFYKGYLRKYGAENVQLIETDCKHHFILPMLHHHSKEVIEFLRKP